MTEFNGDVFERQLFPVGIHPDCHGWATSQLEAIEPEYTRIEEFSTGLPGDGCVYFSQSSDRKPVIRENSAVLCVTSTASLARAIAAISKSFGPIGFP